MQFTEQNREDLTEVLLDWMWETVLPTLQPIADKGGFGTEWQKMCSERTEATASVAAAVAIDAAIDTAVDTAVDADVAYAAASVAGAAASVASAAASAAGAGASAADAARSNFWQKVDPIGVLERATLLNQS